MSGDEQDKAIGNMVLRYADAKKDLAAVRGESSRIADALHGLAAALQHTPQDVAVGGDTITFTCHRGLDREPTKPVRISDLDCQAIRRLSEDATKALETIRSLEPQLKDLGILNSNRSGL